MADETDGPEADGEQGEPTGRAKGGHERARRTDPERRKEIARRAANARWGDASVAVPKAVCGSPDHPLKIGGCEIPCYVLGDGRRVLHQRSMVSALGMARGSSGGTGGDRLAKFVAGDRLKSFVSNELREVTDNPIKFTTPSGHTAYGYEATVLADICDAVLSARKEGLLQQQQQHIAEQCEILVRGFARVGIIALVDEATGYQEIRAKDALARILEAFVAKELQPWVKTFPQDFYAELFRLRKLDFPNDSVKRPPYFGHLTNDLIYNRLAPGVLKELKRVTPKNENGRLKNRLFQSLTTNVGYPKLREHLGSVVAIMKLSRDWDDFMGKLNRIHPRLGDQLRLEFPEEQDDGVGL